MQLTFSSRDKREITESLYALMRSFRNISQPPTDVFIHPGRPMTVRPDYCAREDFDIYLGMFSAAWLDFECQSYLIDWFEAVEQKCASR